MRSCFSYFLYVFTCVVIVVFVTNEIKEKNKKKKKKKRVPTVNQDLPGSSGRGSSRPQRLVCFYCGIPGHFANRCFRRSQFVNRYTPYSRRGRGVNK